jgi:hypothetical protein
MPQNTFPIVGMFYRPPAKALIDALAVGTPLLLIAEPENNFDPNAVAVWLHSKDIPEASYTALEETLPPFGWTLEKVLEEEEHHLGYIPKEMAAQLKACGAVKDGEAVEVTFSTSASGAPRVKFAEAPY